MNNDVVKSLLELSEDITKKQKSLEEAGVHVGYFENISDRIEDIILNSFNVPQDTTVELGLMDENTFCRDIFGDWLFNYQNGELTFEKLIFNLNNWEQQMQ